MNRSGKKLNIVLLGPPGAGKGTQAKSLAQKYKLLHISTGDILRDAVRQDTRLGRQAQSFIRKGELVPDEIVFDLVREYLASRDCENGAVFDGFPRNINQAKMLQSLDYIKKSDCLTILLIDIPEQEAIRRLSNRRYCPNCKSIYNLLDKMPKKQIGESYLCDKCGEKLVARDDDKPATIKHRLQIYHDEIEPMVAFYKDLSVLHTVAGIKSKGAVFEELANIVDEVITNDCKNDSNKK
jgi:adenylate kinase